MQKQWYSINGGARLEGTVTISGAKNASVAIIPAAVLAGECCVLENLPHIQDVSALQHILQELGASVDFTDGDCMRIDPTGITCTRAVSPAVQQMRASYYLLGALLGRYGECDLALPGGCVIGARPIDQHIKGMAALGADIHIDGSILHARAKKLIGTEIFFDMVSVGATINVMLAAARAEGVTTLTNVAKEPHVVDVANFLNMMGASVKGAGTDVIRIRGGRPLHGSNYAVIPDQIETGTLMIAAAATRGDVMIRGAIPTHMESLTAKLLEMGVHVNEADDRIRVRADGKLRPINIKTQVYPGFPTDLQQPMTAMLASVPGSSYVTETIFENRFRYVDELRRMGANIRVLERTAIVEGVQRLRGTRITATDLRAGAAMIVAALIAEGRSEIKGVKYIMRGYERIDEKLRQLGAAAIHKTYADNEYNDDDF